MDLQSHHKFMTNNLKVKRLMPNTLIPLPHLSMQSASKNLYNVLDAVVNDTDITPHMFMVMLDLYSVPCKSSLAFGTKYKAGETTTIGRLHTKGYVDAHEEMVTQFGARTIFTLNSRGTRLVKRMTNMLNPTTLVVN